MNIEEAWITCDTAGKPGERIAPAAGQVMSTDLSRHCAVPGGNSMIHTGLTTATVGCEWVVARFPLEVCVCVLLVEDEPIILLATAFCLEGAGFEVLTAGDGLQAIDLLDQHPGRFTALVTDFHMPLVTGAHLVVAMRRTYPAIPMIITTALTHVVTEGWQLQYAVDMLAKPYDPETLIGMLRSALNG